MMMMMMMTKVHYLCCGSCPLAETSLPYRPSLQAGYKESRIISIVAKKINSRVCVTIKSLLIQGCGILIKRLFHRNAYHTDHSCKEQRCCKCVHCPRWCIEVPQTLQLVGIVPSTSPFDGPQYDQQLSL